jgi:glycosyltransferase involved in cell wall biosynthesis
MSSYFQNLDESPRIIIVVGHLKSGGTEKQSVQLVRELDNAGAIAELWALRSPSHNYQVEGLDKITIFSYSLFEGGINDRFISMVKIINRMRNENRNIYLTQLPDASIAIYLLRCLFGRKRVQLIGVRGFIRKKNRAFEYLLRKTYQDATRLIVNSDHLIEEFGSRFRIPQQKFTVIYNGIGTEYVKHKKENDSVSAVVVSNFHEYKGHSILLECMSEIDTALRIILVGNGKSKENCEKYVLEHNLNDRVIFADECRDVSKVLTECQFAIHPSITEGLSNAIMEEMLHGLPVIAFNIGGNSILVKDKVSGFLIEPFSKQNLIIAINRLAKDSNLRDRMGLESKRAIKIFSWERNLKAHLELIREVSNA